MLEDARLNIEAKGLVLKTDIAPRCAISGDETRLRQVIFNLLTNAIKFTDRGEISATLTSNETSIRFALQDSGIGISVASQDKIFGRFTQALEAGAQRHSGLGLALWIAHTIVTAHHGTLHVESAGPGQGATFIMTLPRSSDPGVLA
ncbi:ATP-binding protein [Robbsia sp. KACC 23696]|uniref:sensor histidine kinase n=1 Tax=Robbsia sp. KACC 23696 TaxID=3149231 RepID=UPI00325C2FDE